MTDGFACVILFLDLLGGTMSVFFQMPALVGTVVFIFAFSIFLFKSIPSQWEQRSREYKKWFGVSLFFYGCSFAWFAAISVFHPFERLILAVVAFVSFFFSLVYFLKMRWMTHE